MCLILLAANEHPDYPLILCGNRDEFYQRPTKEAHYWHENKQIFAGKDLEKGGTWLGVTTSGKIAAVTNVRNIEQVKKEHQTRGEIVTNFFNENVEPIEYVNKLCSRKHSYQGYNAIVGKGKDLYYYSNHLETPVKLGKGVHVVSNAQLNTKWPKTESLKVSFTKIINQHIDEATLIDLILSTLQDQTVYQDDQLPDTGVGIQLERMLSPIFINGDEYGTRASTIVLLRRNGHIRFIEQSYGPKGIEMTKRDELIHLRDS